MAPCPTFDRMNRMAEGEISADDIDAIERHLRECERCAVAVQLLADQDAASINDFASAMTGSDPAIDSLIQTLEKLRPSDEDPIDFLAPPERPDEIGRLGPYRIHSILGRGGMGIVFQAEEPDQQRKIAIKVMTPALMAQASARKRFLREASLATEIRHRNIVFTHHVGEQDGVPFLAMELLEGETLESRLKREATISIPEILRIGREISHGLAAAHRLGLIHRDVKPSNLWLEANSGNVKILDFGLARPVDEIGDLTRSGVILGTPAFMPPEQVNGEGVDHRGDLFSLGCVLYRMATGVVPFPGKDSMTIVWSLASKTPTPPQKLNPAIPSALSALILRLLAKDPAKRPASADEVRAALDAVSLRPKKRGSLVGLLIGAASALAIVLALWLWPAGPDPSPPAAIATPPKSFALEFNGKSGGVAIDAFPFPKDGPYTIEAFATVRQTQPSRSAIIGAGNELRDYSIEMSSYRQPAPTWRFSWKFRYSIGQTPVVVGQRYHLAGVRSAGLVEFFVDGKKDATNPNLAGLPEMENVAFTLGEKFNGTIDRVRISKTARYTDTFTPNDDFAADVDTLALYRFDEGTGEILHDTSGHGRHGKITGATWTPKTPN